MRPFLVFIALGLTASCASSTAATGISPITGVLVRSESLVAGLGCGREPSQVFKYAAVVLDANNTPIAGAAYDCFADGAFVNLPGANFTLQVFAFDAAAYEAQQAAIDSAGANLVALQGLRATWTTQCHATQQENVEVLAVCNPLQPTGSGA